MESLRSRIDELIERIDRDSEPVPETPEYVAHGLASWVECPFTPGKTLPGDGPLREPGAGRGTPE